MYDHLITTQTSAIIPALTQILVPLIKTRRLFLLIMCNNTTPSVCRSWDYKEKISTNKSNCSFSIQFSDPYNKSVQSPPSAQTTGFFFYVPL